MDGDAPSVGRTKQSLLPGFAEEPDVSGRGKDTRAYWLEQLHPALTNLSPKALPIAEAALRACPIDSALLLMAALAALVAKQPDRAIGFLKRFERRYAPNKAMTLLTALALAGKGYAARAWTLLEQDQLLDPSEAVRWFVGDRAMAGWLIKQLTELRFEHLRQRPTTGSSKKPATGGKAAVRPTPRPIRVAPKPPEAAAKPPAVAELPRLEIALDLTFELNDPDTIQLSGAMPDPAWFRIRSELTQLGLVEGFDELLCLPTLQGVEAHWYQIETVRKVLKQYRGRVLLADEVGLGKTIEAGMVLKEYMLRGMAERVLILAPAPLVGQWRDEMATKFGIDCATTHDALLRSDPGAFWHQPRVIASIAVARRREHADLLATHAYDVVVVDEAHHLRDQASASYRLVNALQKRFLLLLSATPVQNSLLELYNLLTLLQPGIFRTQKEFRTAYMTPGKPREPANHDRLRGLMRGVMVRNTRALAALRLPRRHAATIRAVPDAAEAACYEELTALVRAAATGGQARLAVQHLLSAAGSSPAAAAAAVARFAERNPETPGWAALLARYRAASAGAKQTALLKLLAQNPAEKKIVFVHHRDSMVHLAGLLRRQGMAPLLFDGSMSGPEKDAAVAAFQDAGKILLCSESGGEGRNLQFCNTLVNFDIPWNPMAIEQRIGRIDRIGQMREVFVFNLVTAGTIEDAMLRILDEKINMFELVVGEVGAILGEIDDQQDFSSLVLDAWLQSTEAGRAAAFTALESQLLAARRQYEDAKQLDEAIFGNELDAVLAGRMQRFVAALLTEDGALVEPLGPDGLDVLAPPPLQQALGVGEFCRFGFGTTLPEGAQRVGIESDWLACFARVVGERGRWHRRVLSPGARKIPDAEQLLERELTLENATFRLINAAPAWTRYLVLEFRFTAVSDEKREGTQRLAINLATGAMPEAMLDRLTPWLEEDGDDVLPTDAVLPTDWERSRVIERVRRALSWRVEAALAPFIAGLRRRLVRDLDRLHAYHNDLHREASQRAAHLAAGDAGQERERLRLAAIAQEYRAKLADLTHKYALRVSTNWVQTQELVMPVHRLTVQIRRRKAERTLALDWNPLNRRLEPLPCEAGLSVERPRLVCDEALHLVAPAGLAPCAGCGRAYCHACHPERCPKCGQAGRILAFGGLMAGAAGGTSALIG